MRVLCVREMRHGPHVLTMTCFCALLPPYRKPKVYGSPVERQRDKKRERKWIRMKKRTARRSSSIVAVHGSVEADSRPDTPPQTQPLARTRLTRPRRHMASLSIDRSAPRAACVLAPRPSVCRAQPGLQLRLRGPRVQHQAEALRQFSPARLSARRRHSNMSDAGMQQPRCDCGRSPGVLAAACSYIQYVPQRFDM